MGYHRAGFEVVGVDIKPQPRYPFEFAQGDALWLLEVLGRQGSLCPSDDSRYWLRDFDAIHASPPCQRYSMGSRNLGTAHKFPDLIAPTRSLLQATGLPYVIENVDGAPLTNAIMLCGAAFGLGTPEMYLRRHRNFECSFPLMSPGCACGVKRHSIGVYGNGTNSWHREKLGRNVLADEWREAMGIDWMVKTELAQAIPPAYTEHIGGFLLAELAAPKAGAAWGPKCCRSSCVDGAGGCGVPTGSHSTTHWLIFAPRGGRLSDRSARPFFGGSRALSSPSRSPASQRPTRGR